MKLGAREIPGFIKQASQICRAVLVYGPDNGLIQERVKEMALTVVKDLKDAFTVAELGADQLKEEPGRLADELAAISFTGERRLVMLRHATDSHSLAIKEALESVNSNSFLIVSSDELGTRSSLRLHFEAAKDLAALPCYHDDGRDLEAVLKDMLNAKSLSWDREAMEFLMQNLGSDRRVTMNEIEKLALYMGRDTRLTVDVVQEVVGNNTEISLDDIALCTAGGNLPELRARLQKAFREGMHSVGILRAVQRHFLKLYQVHAKMESGMGVEQAIEQLRPPVFYKHKAALRIQASKWKKAHVERALTRLLQAEKEVKSLPVSHELASAHCLMQIASLHAPAKAA